MEDSTVTLNVQPLMDGGEDEAERQYDDFLRQGREMHARTGQKVMERVVLTECHFGGLSLVRMPFLLRLLRRGVVETHAQTTVLVVREGQLEWVRWLYEGLVRHLPTVASSDVVFELAHP